MYSLTVRLDADTSQEELLARVEALNSDPRIHGVLVQMPLPRQIDPDAIIRAIDPAKDVDGFHPVNVAAEHQINRSAGGAVKSFRIMRQQHFHFVGKRAAQRRAQISQPDRIIIHAAQPNGCAASRKPETFVD